MTVELSKRIELLMAKPYPTRPDVEACCRETRMGGYRSITVPSSLIDAAYDLTSDSAIQVCCLIGYPFGQSHPDVKRYETEAAVDLGAHEIELVPSFARLIEGEYSMVLREIRDVVDAAEERSVRVSVEYSLWSEDQLGEIIRLVLDSGAQYLTTSIAPSPKAITPSVVEMLRTLAGPSFGIKIGGLRDLNNAESLVAAGADRIGILA